MQPAHVPRARKLATGAKHGKRCKVGPVRAGEFLNFKTNHVVFSDSYMSLSEFCFVQ